MFDRVMGHRRNWATRTVIAIAGLLVFGVPLAGQAQIAVFHSEHDDGFDDGPVSVRGHTLVHAYFKYNGGATAPNPDEECSAGTPASDEICQWAVRLKTTGNLKIVDVAWGDGSVEDDTDSAPAVERDGTGGVADFGELGAAKLATIAVSGTQGELRLFTPDSGEAPGDFGFVDKEGDIQTVDVGGVLLAAAPVMGWRSISSADGGSCGALANGDIQCWGWAPGALPTVAVRDVVVGDAFGCALDYSGLISCWDSSPPIPVEKYLMLAAGPLDICALTPSLTIECYGPSALVAPGSSFQQVSRGDGFACGLMLDGRASCWGSGFGTTGTNFYRGIAGGFDHVCTLLSDNLVECWGASSTGYSSGFPTGIAFINLTASDGYTCGVRSDNGLVQCWGNNAPSGIPATSFAFISAAPDYVCGIQTDGIAKCWGTLPGGEDADQLSESQIAAGENHTCKIGTDKALECWGSGAATSGVPVGDHEHVAAGSDFSCAIESSTRYLSCWGDASNGKTTPPGGSFTQVVAGSQFACALAPDATIQCWGDDSYQQLFNAPASTSFLQIAAGFYHACGLRTDGTIQCWGRDNLNQASPPGASDFVAVSAGSFHTCGLHSDGIAECWGDNSDGQKVALTGSFQKIAADSVHSCGLRDSGAIECWGGDGQGQASPPSLAFTSVVAGGTETNPGFSCGVGSGGSLLCWGDNAMGQSAPPLDSDGDGYEDPVDNCPFVPNSNLLGSCDDDVLVSCTSNGDCAGSCLFGQGDVDGDGVGDVCDNCLIDPNSDQFDRDGDGAGDACDPTDPFVVSVVSITGSGSLMSSSFATGCASTDDILEIRLSCPAAIEGASQIVSRIQLGVRIPGLSAETASSYHFGSLAVDGTGACDQNGCSSAPDLGDCDGSSTVDGSSANTFVLKPDLAGFPGDSDVLYMSLQGKPLDGTGPPSLCDDLAEEVLARIGLPALPAQESSVTTDGAEDVASDVTGAFAEFTDVGIQDPSGETIPGADWAFATGPQDASVRILLSREVGDDTGQFWLIKLATTGQEVIEITFGIHAEEGADPADYRLLGCGVPGEFAMEPCDAAPFPWIDATLSKTGAGDLINSNTPDVFWMTLRGNLPSADPTRDDVDVLLPVLDTETKEQRVSLGILQVPTGVDNSTTPPLLYQDPIDAAAVASPNFPIVKTPGMTEHILSDRNLTQQAADNTDSDRDGISEDTDNCRYTKNGLGEVNPQRDVGGLVAPGVEQRPDGRGDVCQCGEGDGTGEITDADLMALRHVVARNDPVADEDALARCSVSPDVLAGSENAQSCNIKDLMDLERALSTGSFPGGDGNVCLRARAENLPSI